MALRVFNTESRSKEEFIPIEEGKVGMYVCGPTVYDDCHVGHARSYVAFDVIRRYLEYKGYTVTYVQNFTDVDDKIINRSAEKNIPPLVLSEHYIQEYFRDTGALNIRKADIHPKASETVPDMITVIKGLMEKGYAYEVNGSVYFEVAKASHLFGKLRHQSLEDMRDGARIEVDSEKRSPKDFALWKAAKPGEISWDSPWGKGRPGWHIECSTMAWKYIGRTLDIHGGGMDLIFPHHESEILQAEAFTGKKFVKYWIHNGFVELKSEKMSKSLGNFFTIKDILGRFEPMVLRFFLVYTHYRSPIDFSDSALEEAGRSYERLRRLHELLSERIGEVEEGVIPDLGEPDEDVLKMAYSFRKDFEEAMDDDFNTRVGVTVLFRMDQRIRDLDKEGRLDGKHSLALKHVMDEISGVLGLIYSRRDRDEGAEERFLPELVRILIDVRDEARKRKDWALADSIRDRLRSTGIILEDGETTTWHLARDR
ncbi:MAG TPA: cysteine--tRNA ligase [Euryarchaeota archaeon]|nr:MAG: cysteine--tRNA ligase [Thermoplasmatales archaeon ex4484_6]RLF69067.1 MAG: cysteine--tRNA ligase [Thermoplasmata archaeon]HHD16161.1 cysteine--tRNA ligase [Euryarchaeota archaeon]